MILRWYEEDLRFREDAENAAQIRLDELEQDLESSTHRSGGDVTARIFILKGGRPDKYQERIVQQTWTGELIEPQFKISVVNTPEDAASIQEPQEPAKASMLRHTRQHRHVGT